MKIALFRWINQVVLTLTDYFPDDFEFDYFPDAVANDHDHGECSRDSAVRGFIRLPLYNDVTATIPAYEDAERSRHVTLPVASWLPLPFSPISPNYTPASPGAEDHAPPPYDDVREIFRPSDVTVVAVWQCLLFLWWRKPKERALWGKNLLWLAMKTSDKCDTKYQRVFPR
jgi:hypothetical protein